ncbi:hypothetical protein DRP04_09930 [Archaeoglobales archaeon]|nr:MAG: hypothetical protein DRP04_09930 [Archaeoglobales archaeon]
MGEDAYKLARSLARRYLPQLLVFTTPESLVSAIKNNITLLDKIYEWARRAQRGQLDKERQKILYFTLQAISAVRTIAQANPLLICEFLRPSFVISSLSDTKPLLARILNTKRGRQWLNRSLLQLQQLLGIRCGR